MKSFLTLLFLLISFSVFAGDDLTGKKIFCKKYAQYHEAVLIGFEFTSSDTVKYYASSTFKTKTYISSRAYQISTSKIYVMRGIGEQYKNETDYEIDRRNLSINRLKLKHDFAEGECDVVNTDLITLIDFELQVEKNTNLL